MNENTSEIIEENTNDNPNEINEEEMLGPEANIEVSSSLHIHLSNTSVVTQASGFLVDISLDNNPIQPQTEEMTFNDFIYSRSPNLSHVPPLIRQEEVPFFYESNISPRGSRPSLTRLNAEVYDTYFTPYVNTTPYPSDISDEEEDEQIVDEMGINQNNKHSAMLSTCTVAGASRNRTVSNLKTRYPLSNDEVQLTLQSIKNYLIRDIIDNNELVNSPNEAIELAMHPNNEQWNIKNMAALRFLLPSPKDSLWGSFDKDVMNNDIYGDKKADIFNLQRTMALLWHAANDKKLVNDKGISHAIRAVIDSMYTSQRAYNLDDVKKSETRDEASCPSGTFTRLSIALQGLHPDCVTLLNPKLKFQEELDLLIVQFAISAPKSLNLFIDTIVQRNDNELKELSYLLRDYSEKEKELINSIRNRFSWEKYQESLIKQYGKFNSQDPKSTGMVDEKALRGLKLEYFGNKPKVEKEQIMRALIENRQPFKDYILKLKSSAERDYNLIPSSDMVTMDSNNQVVTLQQVQTPGIGGNCVFRALIMGMYYVNVNQNLNLNHNRLRQAVMNQIQVINNSRNHHPLYEDLKIRAKTPDGRYRGTTIQHYVEWIGKLGNWGGDFEIKVVSDLYNIRIENYPVGHAQPQIYNPKGINGTIRVRHTGNHYNLLVARSSWKRPTNNHPMMVQYHQDMKLINKICVNNNRVGKNNNSFFTQKNGFENTTDKNSDRKICVIL